MMKLVLISDTHGREPELPEGDILVHAGDLTSMGTPDQLIDALAWLQVHSLRFQHTVVIAGNHDFICEHSPHATTATMERMGFHYLHDTEVVIDGIKFWGSPYQPWFHDWAFNVE